MPQIDSICQFQMFPALAPSHLQHGDCANCRADEHNQECGAYRPLALVKVRETISSGEYSCLLSRVGLAVLEY